MTTISRACHITNTNGHELDKTIDIYRRATNYIIDIVILRYDDIMKITGDGKVPAQKKRMAFVENLIHTTKKNEAVYKRFNREFYKFPSYFRRAAIVAALGTVLSYKSLVKNWEDGGKHGNKPFLNKTRALFPCFYRGESLLENDKSPIVSLKIYNGSDWVWKTYTIRSCDFLYPKKNLCGWKKSAPVLEKRGHRYELRFAYTCKSSEFPRFKKDAKVDTVIGVDLGINTDATCSAIKKNGTVMGQKFINHPIEKDRMYKILNEIKQAQQNGNHKTPRLWRFANNYNTAIATMTASEIVKYAVKNGAQVIVFEHLTFKGKKHGAGKQKLALWRKREVQRRTEALANRFGIRVSYICAVNTSRLAYDGSGKVSRGIAAGFKTNKLCKFSTGKVFNCDLSASRNIAARYFIRALSKSLSAKEELQVLAKVPEFAKRTSCCLNTLVEASRILKELSCDDVRQKTEAA